MMDVDGAAQGPPQTILRIKRKRNEEPLDALVIESGVRRKKSRGALDVFQFAQTVDENTWKNEAQRKAIQDQISLLSRESGAIQPQAAPPTVLPSRDMNRRYTVVPQDAAKNVSSQKSPSVFQVYDAVPAVSDGPLDPEMEQIQDLLNNYLKMERPEIKSGVPEAEDYVWDIFYRRPAGFNALTGGAIGTLMDVPSSFVYDSDSEFEEEEDEADEDSNAEDNYKNDYPDEENFSDQSDPDDRSDEFHENSQEEDYFYDADSDPEHEWR